MTNRITGNPDWYDENGPDAFAPHGSIKPVKSDKVNVVLTAEEVKLLLRRLEFAGTVGEINTIASIRRKLEN